MGLVFLDGGTVRDFVNDERAFVKEVESIFDQLDRNNDGVLSKCELRPAFERLNIIGPNSGAASKMSSEDLKALYDRVFEQFDTDNNQIVDRAEFIEQVKQILLAVADGLGNNPFNVLVEEGSMLAVAAAHERASCKV